jgi:uncharacterized membrane-anchored protein
VSVRWSIARQRWGHSRTGSPERVSFWIHQNHVNNGGRNGRQLSAVNEDWGQSITRGVMAACLLVAFFCSYVRGAIFPAFIGLPLLVSMAGTQITDALIDDLGVSLYISTTVFAVGLAIIFSVWYRIERTLSIHTIVTWNCSIGLQSYARLYSVQRPETLPTGSR